MMELKRTTDVSILDPARIIATIYTLGYFYIVYLLMTTAMPVGNADTMNQLIGALTIIQTAIIQYYFGGSRSAEAAQTQTAASKAQSDVVIGEIAKAAPMPGTAPVPPPIQAENVDVVALNATLTERKDQ